MWPARAKGCYCSSSVPSLLSQLKSPPNLVTIGRVLLVPPVLLMMDNYDPLRSLLAGLLYLAAAAGDGLDGYLARKRGEVSVLGKFLDPLADKLMVMAVLIYMVALGRAPAWAVVLLIARDLAITGLRSIASAEGMVIAASDGGKIKTALQLVAVASLLIHFRHPLLGLATTIDFHLIGLGTLYVSLAASYVSGAGYVRGFFAAMSARG